MLLIWHIKAVVVHQLYQTALMKPDESAARFVKSRYSRYSSDSDMFDLLGWTPLSQRRQEAQLILFYKIINGLAFEGVFVEVYKGTRRKHNLDRLAIKLASMDSCFFLKLLAGYKTGARYSQNASVKVSGRVPKSVHSPVISSTKKRSDIGVACTTIYL